MGKMSQHLIHVFLFFLLINHCVGPPTKHQAPDNSSKSEDNQAGSIDDLGLEYNRYLKEVVDALESDPEFRKKLETAQEADFVNGKAAAELEYVNHNVRTKLDELKRTELQRLRDLVHQADELDKNIINPNHFNPQHLDHTNPHTFEVADLHKLLTQVRKDLAEADRKRREEFKEYEMEKKFEQEQKVKVMDEENKKQYLHELEEQKKKHQQHDPLHHPGSKAQLEEVWEKEDHMENQQFNPRTFFMLHDVNGDGYWDEEEVSALFVKELNKLYQPGHPEDDMRERHEEMERMREHVFKEADINGDRLISFEEFLEQTKRQEFNRDEGWDTIDTQPQFSQQEYEEFERRRQQEIQHMIDQGLMQPYAPGMMPPHHGYPQHPGQPQQQYNHPGAMSPQQYGQNTGYHPQGAPGHYPQGQSQQSQDGIHPQGVPQNVQYAQPGHHPGQSQYGAHHPNQISQQGAYHPNQAPQQGVYHPNQAPQQGAFHPNQVPQHGGHPNQVPQQGHHNQVPQQGHHNQVPQQGHPNQVPQQGHHNQVPQQGYPNQVPQQGHHNPVPQQGAHPNQVHQQGTYTNQAPQQGAYHANQSPLGTHDSNPQQYGQAAHSQDHNQVLQQNPVPPASAHSNSSPEGQNHMPQYSNHVANQIPLNQAQINNHPPSDGKQPPSQTQLNQVAKHDNPSVNQMPQYQDHQQVNQGSYNSQLSQQLGKKGQNQIDSNPKNNNIPKR